jgi:hypothetical protein
MANAADPDHVRRVFTILSSIGIGLLMLVSDLTLHGDSERKCVTTTAIKPKWGVTHRASSMVD